MDDEKKSNNDYDCTDCMHYGVCYAIARGRDPKDPCKDLELEPWCVDKDDKNQQ